MIRKKIIVILSFIYTCIGICNAQNVTVDILQQGSGFSDSAYYDILKVDQSNYWLVGKYGIITNYNSENNLITPVKYPSSHQDIYRIGKFTENNYIGCADKGTVYFFNPAINSWRTVQVKGYEKSCFYSVATVDSKTAFICGGSSAIAHSKKTIPQGFIIKTTDGGETWTKVYSSTFKMVWSLKFNNATNELMALIYSPNHTSLYTSKDNGSSWQFEKKMGKGIYYDLEFDKENNLVCYGGEINGNGKLITGNDKEITFNKSGLIWYKTQLAENRIMTACNGNILFASGESDYELIHTELTDKFSLYKAEFINSNKVIVVGSGRTILLVNISENFSSN